MGLTMAGGAPQLEKREGRTIVVVPPAKPASPGSKDGGRSWWAEKDDVVFSVLYPWGPTGVMAALDGKVPSAVDHPIVKELFARDGTFEPVGIAFVDAEHTPSWPVETGLAKFLHKLNESAGIRRLAAPLRLRRRRPDERGPDRGTQAEEVDPGAVRSARLRRQGADTAARGDRDVRRALDQRQLPARLDRRALAGERDQGARSTSSPSRCTSSGKIDFRKDFLGTDRPADGPLRAAGQVGHGRPRLVRDQLAAGPQPRGGHPHGRCWRTCRR